MRATVAKPQWRKGCWAQRVLEKGGPESLRYAAGTQGKAEEAIGMAFMGGILRLPSKFDSSGGWIEAERLSENDGEVRFKETVRVGSVRPCQRWPPRERTHSVKVMEKKGDSIAAGHKHEQIRRERWGSERVL